ncbi:hypothetical protein [uncultured Arthrobacter sp.]|uniref:hypothetical protein n=1 Tax=uncultured Arthrobacter sp. TaxID=114050 RepID=UPI00260B4949|nr:hypothetical protein [uncultured Arthrobacter sp.]
MSELILPVVVLLASLVFTYFFCLRPMRRGQCTLGRQARQAGEQTPSAQAEELTRLREQVEALKTGQHQSSRL